MARYIDNADVEPLLVRPIKNQLGKAELNCDLSRFFFRQAIGISSRERLDKRALAVIDVTGSRNDEMLFGHVSF